MEGLVIRNIHNVELSQERASLGSRIAATLIDYAVIFTYIGLFMIWEPIRESIRSSGTLSILLFLPVLLYHFLMEVLFNGKSVGKFAMGIRVMKLDGSPPSVASYLLRWLFRMLDMLFAWTVGILAIILNRQGQRIGDLAAGTLVVKESHPPSIDRIWQAPEEGRKVAIPEAARLSDQEVELLREALERSKKSSIPLQKLLARIRERTGMQSDLGPDELASRLIADHDELFKEGKTAKTGGP
ncbi:MAG: RDD family protein [Flavobacteriales bacterium]